MERIEILEEPQCAVLRTITRIERLLSFGDECTRAGHLVTGRARKTEPPLCLTFTVYAVTEVKTLGFIEFLP